MMATGIIPVFAVAAMHEQVHQRTSQQQQIRKNAEYVRSMLREQEEADDCQKPEQHDASQ